MKIGQRLNKPEYLFRPTQVLHRISFLFDRYNAQDLVAVRLPWGGTLHVKPTDAIGRSLLTVGVHELAVSEALWRLADEGDTCIDVGANIGYMTALLSTRVGISGRVISFEPHPHVFKKLKMNVRFMNNSSRVRPVESAIGAIDAVADLSEPPGFAGNEGIASIAFSTNSEAKRASRYPVKIQRLDSIFPDGEEIGVIKIDVEGAEAQVFQGAESLMRAQDIRDMVCEESSSLPAELLKFISECRYTVIRFSKRIFGLRLRVFNSEKIPGSLPWETRNLLITREPERALARLSARGWRCLG